MHLNRSLSFLTIALALALALLLLLLLSPAHAQTQNEILFQRAIGASECKQVPNNGRYCEYEFKNVLTIAINDVGGNDPVVGFRNSNIKNEFYAVLYLGCISVVPGEAYLQKYDRNFGVHISPKTGLVYMSVAACRASL